MRHLVTVTYTNSRDEHVKGCLLYEDCVLTEAHLHPTFVAEYWVGAQMRAYVATDKFNKKGTAELIAEAKLTKRKLDEVPITLHKMFTFEEPE